MSNIPRGPRAETSDKEMGKRVGKLKIFHGEVARHCGRNVTWAKSNKGGRIEIGPQQQRRSVTAGRDNLH